MILSLYVKNRDCLKWKPIEKSKYCVPVKLLKKSLLCITQDTVNLVKS